MSESPVARGDESKALVSFLYTHFHFLLLTQAILETRGLNGLCEEAEQRLWCERALVVLCGCAAGGLCTKAQQQRVVAGQKFPSEHMRRNPACTMPI